MGSMGEDLTNWTIDQWTPIGPSPYSLAWDNGSQSVVVSPSEDGRTSFGLNNILYYLFLVPIGLLCNALTFTVVVIIMRNRRSRQSVPDACVCLLTAIDLLSILFIHSPTILASAAGRWSSVQTPPPTKLCVYQAFATSVYLKFQFLVQVTMALDRFFAITTPLNYHRLQSFTTFKIIIAATVTASVSSTALLFAFDAGRLRDITTWGFCYFEWQLQSTADYVINIGITLIFAAGFLAFLFSNAALVRFFWLYDFHKAEILVRDISKAMKAVEKTEKQESEGGTEGGRAPCAEGEQVAMIDVTMRDQQRSPPHLNVGDDVIDCSAAKDNRLLSNEDESMTNQRRPIDDDNMTTTELTTQHINPQDTRDCAWPTGEGTVKGAVEGSRGWCSVDEDDGSSAIGRAIDGNPLDDDAGLRCHGFTKQKLNNKGATEINDRYDDAIEQTLNTDVALIGPTTVTNALDQPSHHQHQRNQSIHLPILSRRSSLIHPLHVACLDHGPHADHGPYSVHATHSDHVTHPDHRRHRGGSGLLRMSETPNRSTLMSSKTKAEVSDVDVAALHLRNCWSLSTITGGCADHASPPDDKRNHFIPCKQVIRRGNRSLPPVRRFHPSRPAAPAAVEQATEAAETLQTTDDSEKVSQSMIYILERIRNLVERSKRNTRRQNRQLVLLKCVLLCSFVFVVTWLPYTILQFLIMLKHEISDVFIELSMKLVFANALFNALLHGLLRRNYRKGFHYIARTVANVLCCGLISKPSDDLVFYDSKKTMRTLHQKAADMNRSMKALQAIQQTLRHASRAASASWSAGTRDPLSPAGAAAGDSAGASSSPPVSAAEFFPSKRLQELFDQCLQDSAQFDDDSDTSSDIDYDALVFAEQVKIYDELRTVWSQVRL